MKNMLITRFNTSSSSQMQKLFVFVLVLTLFSMHSCTLDIFESDETPEELELRKQEMLDSGMTPFEVYLSLDSTVNKNIIGFKYQGGIIITFNIYNGEGIIASKEDIGNYSWGCNGVEIADLATADFLFLSEVDDENYQEGSFNSDLILHSGCASENTAAQACAEYESEGYDDWFLPGITLMRSLDIAGARGRYWSSTGVIEDYDQNHEYAMSYILGTTTGCTPISTFFGTAYNCKDSAFRNTNMRVRAVRKFY